MPVQSQSYPGLADHQLAETVLGLEFQCGPCQWMADQEPLAGTLRRSRSCLGPASWSSLGRARADWDCPGAVLILWTISWLGLKPQGSPDLPIIRWLLGTWLPSCQCKGSPVHWQYGVIWCNWDLDPQSHKCSSCHARAFKWKSGA